MITLDVKCLFSCFRRNVTISRKKRSAQDEKVEVENDDLVVVTETNTDHACGVNTRNRLVK